MNNKRQPDYVDGSWHLITFHSDLAETEVTHFANKLRGAFESSGMPSKCEARRHENSSNGIQTVFLSPTASRLTRDLPTYAPLLESCFSPSNFAELKLMRIFD
jgi:hypothetical protein